MSVYDTCRKSFNYIVGVSELFMSAQIWPKTYGKGLKGFVWNATACNHSRRPEIILGLRYNKAEDGGVSVNDSLIVYAYWKHTGWLVRDILRRDHILIAQKLSTKWNWKEKFLLPRNTVKNRQTPQSLQGKEKWERRRAEGKDTFDDMQAAIWPTWWKYSPSFERAFCFIEWKTKGLRQTGPTRNWYCN